MRAAPEDRLDAFTPMATGAYAPKAAKASKRPRTYEEFWAMRPLVESKAAPPPCARAPIIAAIVATLIGALALVALREKIVRVPPPLAGAYHALNTRSR